MTFRQTLLSTAAMALIGAPHAAFADVSAQDVWSDWKSYMQAFGYNVEGSEATSGDTLTISEMKMMVDLPDEEGSVSIDLTGVTFTNMSDGSVEIKIPETMPISFKFNTEKDEPIEGVLDYTNSDLSIKVSGDPANMTYQTNAAELALAVRTVTVAGTTIPLNAVNMKLGNVTSKMEMKIGNLREVVQSFAAASLSYDIDIPPIDGNTFKLVGSMNALNFDGTGAYPMGGFDPQDMSAMLKAGFAFTGMFTHQGGNIDFDGLIDGEAMQGKSTTQSGSLKVAMDADQLHYTAAATGLTSNMTGGGIPLPVEINAENSSFNFKMPVGTSDEAKDFEFGILLGGFTTSEMLWSMVDPTAQLPRDPATLNIDLAGKAKLLIDIFNPEEAAKMEAGTAPGEVESLEVRALQLKAAGADLTGKGAFTFDNSDMETIPGMPKPTGAVELKLTGGNGLLDKLVAMGLVQDEQAMGARMMMGLFAVAGEGEDTLNSKIEVNEEGHVLANGQRLR
ncbi:DUF2125 domain-containing protein [Lentibacter algarum]|uniref:DUF2125 domain-containing protein n=1 Tax=Lentibacter algarum TaxID=576131 RepID=UPI001C071B37|nr:DUF2125 domain-containing protein [Lentibacter algarum]MBU2980389.1 DUF2125 domain-containing protein [Lentibacter algarum]